jgi:hypothetical protein
MALSADITAVQAYLAYVQDYGDQLITRAFYTPKTLNYATVHEGVKGKKTLTRLKVATGKAVSWSSGFSAASNAVSFEPRTLEVAPIKRDLSFVPQDFESSYLGKMRPKGQNPGKFLPFEGDVLQTILNGHSEEFASALWGAVKAGTVTPGTTVMASCFNGFLKIIADAITATTLSPVVTPGGAVTNTNAVALLETMWNSLGAPYKETPVQVFMSWANFQKYSQDYRERYGKYTRLNETGEVKLDFSQNATLVPLAELGSSNRIVMTPGTNLNVGFDDLQDDKLFQMEQNKRVIDWWMDWDMGVQIAQLDEGALVVNDLA